MKLAVVYDNGVFRPREPVSLPQGLEAVIQIPDKEEPSEQALREADEYMKRRFPRSYGCLSHEAAEEMRIAIEEARANAPEDDDVVL